VTEKYVDDEILKQVADSIIEDFKETDETFTPEQETQFRVFVAGLVDAEPPEDEDLWQTIEILRRAIEGKDKENALRAVTTFMLQFISGCEPSSGALKLLPMFIQTREAIKANRFNEAKDLLMDFLNKSREVARSM
jgi:hypothetical protein